MIKNGILLTGAAARISQEVAVLDLLFADGLKISQDESFLVGYSSGAMNLLALNGCFRKENPLDWNTYYKEKILFQLKDSDVFEIFPRTGKSLLNTAPFRPFLGGILNDMGFNSFGALPFRSYVLTSQVQDLATYWANNQKPGHGQLDPTDLFMASTSIPVVLPSQEVKNTDGSVNRDFPMGEFIDGGTWGAFKNYANELGDFIKKNGPMEELHVISPMRETLEELESTKNHLIKKHSIIETAKIDLTNFKKHFKIGLQEFLTFLSSLNTLNAKKDISQEIFVSLPAMKKNTGILSFGKQKETYDTVHDWLSGEGKDQLKVPIADFLRQNGKD